MSDWTPELEARLRLRLGPMWSDIRHRVTLGHVRLIAGIKTGFDDEYRAEIYTRLGQYSTNPIFPLAQMWYGFATSHQIVIRYMSTVEQTRRLGLQKMLLDAACRSHSGIRFVTTPAGNRRSTPWLERHGFKRHPECGWLLEL